MIWGHHRTIKFMVGALPPLGAVAYLVITYQIKGLKIGRDKLTSKTQRRLPDSSAVRVTKNVRKRRGCSGGLLQGLAEIERYCVCCAPNILSGVTRSIRAPNNTDQLRRYPAQQPDKGHLHY